MQNRALPSGFGIGAAGLTHSASDVPVGPYTALDEPLPSFVDGLQGPLGKVGPNWRRLTSIDVVLHPVDCSKVAIPRNVKRHLNVKQLSLLVVEEMLRVDLVFPITILLMPGHIRKGDIPWGLHVFNKPSSENLHWLLAEVGELDIGWMTPTSLREIDQAVHHPSHLVTASRDRYSMSNILFHIRQPGASYQWDNLVFGVTDGQLLVQSRNDFDARKINRADHFTSRPVNLLMIVDIAGS